MLQHWLMDRFPLLLASTMVGLLTSLSDLCGPATGGRAIARTSWRPCRPLWFFQPYLMGINRQPRLSHVQARAVSDANQETAEDAIDWEDIQASLGGDQDAFARLVARYQQLIAGYMWRFTRHHSLWEELIQDVFVEAYVSLPTYKRRSPWSHWLKCIATRVGYRFWRQRQRREPEVALDESTLAVAVVDHECSATDAAELVHFLLGRLSPRDRLVMTLSYLESHSIQQIAELTGWSSTMVKVQMHRARKRLKTLCSELEIEL